MYTDHPRSRGVYVDLQLLDTLTKGSSPLARGLLQLDADRAPPQRIIPARAGFTGGWCPRRRGHRDHPRSRGVYPSRKCQPFLPRGSSPLARGLHTCHRGADGACRIIPARAGFTQDPFGWSRYHRDHPRSRGVYGPYNSDYYADDGSSPLARGLQWEKPHQHPDGGIIPARAGFTPAETGASDSRQDHPRSRGVYPVKTGSGLPVAGSSPLARGLPQHGLRLLGVLRIIPARAGFTSAPKRSPADDRDHPRSRGVYISRRKIGVSGGGSSPLARGLRGFRPLTHPRLRIIPARAGFTESIVVVRSATADHPRSRGVY